jgi:hypothetical protein
VVADAPYPVTIVRTRYGGTYEGAEFDEEGQVTRAHGRWAAFNCHPDELPGDAFGDDTVAASWWGDVQRDGSAPHPRDPRSRLYVGVGLTPDVALAALEQAMADAGA